MVIISQFSLLLSQWKSRIVAAYKVYEIPLFFFSFQLKGYNRHVCRDIVCHLNHSACLKEC